MNKLPRLRDTKLSQPYKEGENWCIEEFPPYGEGVVYLLHSRQAARDFRKKRQKELEGSGFDFEFMLRYRKT